MGQRAMARLVARCRVKQRGSRSSDGRVEEERCRGLREAFAMYEVKGEGCITPASLMRMLARLGSEQGIEECRAMIRRFDLNGMEWFVSTSSRSRWMRNSFLSIGQSTEY